jgi:hypothetical protein
MAVKAVKKVVKAVKPKKGKAKPKKVKKQKPKITGKQIYEIVAETLQHNSDGEFDLPSVMVRYLDRSHPRHRLGLHREYYIPARDIKYYPPSSEFANTIFHNQASMILPAIVGEGYPITEKEYDPPFCSKHAD